jgi:actin related protein 2/3 complex subunit 2
MAQKTDTAKSVEKGFIILETAHPIVSNTFKTPTRVYKKKLTPWYNNITQITETLTDMFAPDAKVEPVDIKIADFDGVEYQILVDPDKKDEVNVSMKMRCAKDLMPMGTKMVLDTTFGQANLQNPLNGYDVTLKFSLANLPADKPTLIRNCAELRYLVMGAPMSRCFDALSKDGAGSLKPMIINYRPKESIYIQPLADRILIFYSIDFFDDTDRAIATIFLQEFAEAQRRIQNAPAVSFTKEPPGQLKSVPGFSEGKSCVGYVMFTVFKLHVDKPEKIKNATNLFIGFHAYLHYHIKAAKTQLQTRMRSRVEMLLKVLNRANPSAAEAEKAAGRRNTTTNTTKTFRKF